MGARERRASTNATGCRDAIVQAALADNILIGQEVGILVDATDREATCPK